MIRTGHANFGVAIGVKVTGDTLEVIDELTFQVNPIESQLIRLREECYDNESNSVYNITLDDAIQSVDFEPTLSERKLDEIYGLNNAYWSHVYETHIFSTPWKEDPNSEPVSLSEALEKQRGMNNSNPMDLLFSAEDVRVKPYSVNETEITIESREGELKFITDEVGAEYLEEVDAISLSFHSDKTQDAIEEMVGIELKPVQLSGNIDSHRVYTDEDGEYSRQTIKHIRELRNCDNPYYSADAMETFASIFTGGYFTRGDKLRNLLFLSEYSDSLLIPDRPVPEFVEILTDKINVNYTQVPQRGAVLISRKSIPTTLTELSNDFPEKQQLTDGDKRALFECMGYPEWAIKLALDDPSARMTRSLENIALQYQSMVISGDEIRQLQFVDYPISSNSEELSEVLSESNKRENALLEYDSKYNFSYGQEVVDGIYNKEHCIW